MWTPFSPLVVFFLVVRIPWVGLPADHRNFGSLYWFLLGALLPGFLVHWARFRHDCVS